MKSNVVEYARIWNCAFFVFVVFIYTFLDNFVIFVSIHLSEAFILWSFTVFFSLKHFFSILLFEIFCSCCFKVTQSTLQSILSLISLIWPLRCQFSSHRSYIRCYLWTPFQKWNKLGQKCKGYMIYHNCSKG